MSQTNSSRYGGEAQFSAATRPEPEFEAIPLGQTTTDTSTTPLIAGGGSYGLLQMDSGFGAFLAAPEPMTDSYSSSATHSEVGQPITQEVVLQAAEMGDYATVLDFASQNTSQYDFDSIAAMPDNRGYFERIGGELLGSDVVDQPLGERIENAAVAAYSGDRNNKLDGIESRVLVAKGWGRSLVDGLQGLAQDPFSIIRDPAILGYDQIQTAFYYGTDGLLGDPNSVARNQGRSESLYNFVEAAKASTNDPEMAGYLFGTAVLGLKKGKLPSGTNTKIDTSGYTKLSSQAKRYLDDLEAQTGLKVGAGQRALLADDLRNNTYSKKLPKEAQKSHRADFDNNRASLIAEWEKNTGQKWPVYKSPATDKNGVVRRRAGRPYDAHHIIESSYNGPNKWWNLHPAKWPDQHQGGIHRSGGVVSEIFPRTRN